MSTTEVARVQVYSVGICAASCCAAANADREEVERAVNADQPTGISSRWEIADEPFAEGTPNGSVCPDDPSRKHWLLFC